MGILIKNFLVEETKNRVQSLLTTPYLHISAIYTGTSICIDTDLRSQVLDETF